jgi:glutamyl-tRNA synthetase
LVPGGEEKMLETLEGIGLHADESPKVGGPYGPYRQSERLEIYKKYAEELVAKKVAYYCTCSKERLDQVRLEKQQQKQIPKYDKHCVARQDEVRKEIEKGSPYVIRLNVTPDKEVVFNDLLRGEIKFNTNDIDDQVLLKSDGFPTYHLAVVVDDYLMKISHIIRAEEWLPSTPKHVLLYQGFGWGIPIFVHVSLLRNPDRSKLSKRKNPVWASDYLAQGILPEAFLNYLALMGWSHPEGNELFDLDEYVRFFDLKDVLKTAPVFDPVKLAWMNGEYLRKLPIFNFQFSIEKYLKEYNDEAYAVIQRHRVLFEKSVPLVQERIKKLSEYWDLVKFLFTRPTLYDIDMFPYKEALRVTSYALQEITEWNATTIGEAMQKVCEELGMKRGDYFMMMRVAISGKKVSSPLNESMELLGKEECMTRLIIN